MTESTREDLLKRVLYRAETDDPAAIPSVSWEDIAPIITGLVLAQRPISAATKSVTERHDLGPRGCYILSLISGGIVFPVELASVLRIGRSLVTSELGRLTAAGLIFARAPSGDRRRTELALTPAGETACEEVRIEMYSTVARNLSAYSVDEIRLFARMLADVRKVADSDLPD